MYRIVAFILICLYLPASLNATVTAHYCMGRLTGVDVWTPVSNDNRCDTCRMLKKERQGCCHDKQETLQLSKDQVSPAATVVAVPFFIALQSHFFILANSFFESRADVSTTAHSPPLANVSLLLFYCVFKI